MPDVFTKAKRSAVMSRIRGRGNRDTELRLIALFRAHGITGWRRQVRFVIRDAGRGMRGAERSSRNARRVARISADFVFRRERVVGFVDGCFWHRHPGCRFAYTPKSRLEFWLPKFDQNVARDRLVNATLKKHGWRVIRVWECALSPSRAPRTVQRIVGALMR
jgi:DNA mismatch endonuclease, patch repair protein